MVDISMCSWKECPIGSDCYRLQAVPAERLQSFADFSDAYSKELKLCSYKIPMTKKGIHYANKEKGKTKS